MATNVDRRTVDLSQYPNLVVIYLGMRVNRLTGLKTLFGFGPRIYDDIAKPIGFMRFAPVKPARGAMFGAAHRAAAAQAAEPVVSEKELYGPEL